MFKKFGVLAFVLAGAMFLQPAYATAAEWHNGGGPYVREHREPIRRFDRDRFEGNRFRDYRWRRYEERRGYYAAPAPFYSFPAYGYGPRCR